MAELKFWGIRGSFPTCEKNKLIYGGNTTCISIEADNKLIILDAGTGIINLSNEYFEKYDEFHIFMSHTHIDHIQGLPYFRPLYTKEKSVYIYGSGREGLSFEEIIRGFISKDYFPVPFENMTGIKKIIEIEDRDVNKIGRNLEVEALKVNKHPIFGVLILKISFGKQKIIFATDVECTYECDPEIINFMKNATVLLHDGTYTDNNYKHYIGWGHSTYQVAIKNSQLAQAEKLYIIHYDPNDNDELLENRKKLIRSRFENIYMPKEGDIISL